MNDNDLQSLGIKEMTHRRRILDAIRELNADKERSRSQSFIQHGKHQIKKGKLTENLTVALLAAHWF